MPEVLVPPADAPALPGGQAPATPLPADDAQAPWLATAHALRRWLPAHCALAGDLEGGFIALRGSGALQVVARHPDTHAADPGALDVAMAALSTRRRAIAACETSRAADTIAIAHPLTIEGDCIGVAVVVLRGTLPPSSVLLDRLDASVATLGQPLAPTRMPPDTVSLLPLLQAVFAQDSPPRGAAALAMRLATALDCERVSIALLEGDRIGIAGSSDGWEADARSLAPERIVEFAALAAEAIDNGATVACPRFAAGRVGPIAAHLLWSARHEARALCSVPWFIDGEPVGALVAERAHAAPFVDEEVTWLEAASRSVAPWFGLQRRLHRPWRRRVGDVLRDVRPGLARGRHRLAAALAAGVIALFLGWPIERELVEPVHLEGSVQRVLSAPGDSFVRQVLVRPGEHVSAGQVLVEFEQQDLQVERERLQAELASRDAATGDALARDDLGALALQRARLDETRAQLALLDQRLARARLVAPIDGIVIQGDLSQSIGSPVRRGDALLTLAPSGAFRAIVEVDDRDIAAVHEGQRGSMTLTALPDRALPIDVVRITPLATVAPGRSYFEAEVALEPSAASSDATTADRLRPGMQGLARLPGATGPRVVVWTREATTWLRFMWWRWIG